MCPQFVNDFHGFEDTVEHVIKNVVALSKEIDLEMKVDDVTELLESHGEELSAEDLIQMEKQIIEEEEEEETPTPEPKAYTRQALARGFSEMQQALATFEAQNPNLERFTRVSRGVMDLLQCYKEILDEKRLLSVQTNLKQYFKKVERPETDPVPSTSAASTTPDSSAPEFPAPSECSASPPGQPRE